MVFPLGPERGLDRGQRSYEVVMAGSVSGLFGQAASASSTRPAATPTKPGVPTESNPAILMVQSAQDRAADDIPGPLNAAMDGGILVQ